jgi:small subunit ribosomal protein S21
VNQIQAAQFFVANQTANPFRPRGRAPLACNDNSGRHCPQCNKEVIAAVSSDYRGAGLVLYSWLCAACGHDWVTKSHLPS